MMDYQTCLGMFGSPYVIVWRGKDYPLAFRTQKFKAALESWVKSKAISVLVEMKAGLPDEDYQALLRETKTAISRGDYAFGQPSFSEIADSQDGKMQVMRLLLSGGPGAFLNDEDLSAFLTDNADAIGIWNEAFVTLRDESDPEKKAELTKMGLIF